MAHTSKGEHDFGDYIYIPRLIHDKPKETEDLNTNTRLQRYYNQFAMDKR